MFLLQTLRDEMNATKAEISSVMKRLTKERAKLEVEGQLCDILKMFSVLFPFFCFLNAFLPTDLLIS